MDELHKAIDVVGYLSVVFHVLEYRINSRYIIKHFYASIMYFDTDLIYKNHNDE